jgi:hypothetical protein
MSAGDPALDEGDLVGGQPIAQERHARQARAAQAADQFAGRRAARHGKSSVAACPAAASIRSGKRQARATRPMRCRQVVERALARRRPWHSIPHRSHAAGPFRLRGRSPGLSDCIPRCGQNRQQRCTRTSGASGRGRPFERAAHDPAGRRWGNPDLRPKWPAPRTNLRCAYPLMRRYSGELWMSLRAAAIWLIVTD